MSKNNEWIEFESNPTIMNQILKEDGDCLVKFDNGQILRHKDEWPLASLTHFKRINRLSTQFGTALIADFEECTWTFEMPESYEVSAGEFAIIPKEKYNKLYQTLLRFSMIEDAAFGLKSFDVNRFKSDLKQSMDDVF